MQSLLKSSSDNRPKPNVCKLLKYLVSATKGYKLSEDLTS
jgi:hypothetical protein